MRHFSYLFLLLVFLTSCNSHEESFCACASRQVDLSFRNITTSCGHDPDNLNETFLLNQIDSCQVFKESVLELQDKMILNRAVHDRKELETVMQENSWDASQYLNFTISSYIVEQKFDSLAFLSDHLKSEFRGSIEHEFVFAYALFKVERIDDAKAKLDSLINVTGDKKYMMNIKLISE